MEVMEVMGITTGIIVIVVVAATVGAMQISDKGVMMVAVLLSMMLLEQGQGMMGRDALTRWKLWRRLSMMM